MMKKKKKINNNNKEEDQRHQHHVDIVLVVVEIEIDDKSIRIGAPINAMRWLTKKLRKQRQR